MTTLLIENDGEIDVNGLRLLGATSKEGQENKIGFFGTGTKYAIATAMRLGIGVSIFSGEKPIKINRRKICFRNEEYEEITINDEPTGITTRTGIQWETWFIIREFLCNAIDEGGHHVDITNHQAGVHGKTRVYIELNTEIRDVYEKWDHLFSFEREPFFCSGDKKCFLPAEKNNGIVYRKGIKIWDSKQNTVFDYDFPSLKINEARVAVSDFSVAYEIVLFLKNVADSKMINILLKSGLDTFEMKQNWEWGFITKNTNWRDALKNTTIIPQDQSGFYAEEMQHTHIILPNSMCLWLYQSFGNELDICGIAKKEEDIIILEPTDRHKKLLTDSINFLKSGGFSDIDKWPILIADLGYGYMGKYEDGKIYINDTTFSMGRRQIAETLLEEYAHAKTKQKDETREFQNVLLRFVIDAIENKTGIYL